MAGIDERSATSGRPFLRMAAAAWLILGALAVGYVLGFRHGHRYAWDHAEYCGTPVPQVAGTAAQREPEVTAPHMTLLVK